MTTRSALFVATFLLTLSCFKALAQQSAFDGVVEMRMHNSGYIMENDALAGYYFFYKYDKLDKRTNAYTLRLVDTDLNEVKQVDMPRSSTSVLTEMVYNGSAFCMTFIDMKEKVAELIILDKKGVQIGRKLVSDSKQYSAYVPTMYSESGEANQSIYPLGTTGFVKQFLTKDDKRGFEMVAFGNDLKESWRYRGSSSSMHQVADVLAVSEDLILLNIYKMKNVFDKPDQACLLVVDARTGKKLFEEPLKRENANLSLLNAFIAPGGNEFVLVGEHYGPKDNIIGDRSQGFYLAGVDREGKVNRYQAYDWLKDVKPMVPAVDDKEKDLGRIWFHRGIRGQDGSVYLIGEQYRVSVSGAGMMNQLSDRGASSSTLRVDDMVLVTIDPELQLKEVMMIDKQATRVALPAGATYWSPSFTAAYMKNEGAFDYAFTMVDKDKDRFFCSYVDYSKERDSKGDKVGTYVGTIVVDKGKSTTDKIDVRSKSSYYRVLPAKPGYILMQEYFRKENQVKVRLERVNY